MSENFAFLLCLSYDFKHRDKSGSCLTFVTSFNRIIYSIVLNLRAQDGSSEEIQFKQQTNTNCRSSMALQGHGCREEDLLKYFKNVTNVTNYKL